MGENRKRVIQIVFLLVGVTFLARLFVLQILDDGYKVQAMINATARLVQIPERGQIYDRNGKLIVYNSPVYDLMVITRKSEVADTLAFCDLLGVSRPQLDSLVRKMRGTPGYKSSKPAVFMGQLSTVDFAKIQDGLVDYPGYFVVARTRRHYPYANMANTLGYVGEINPKQLERQTDDYYNQGDYVGLSGLEQSYEAVLRGRKGVKYMMKDVKQVERGSFREGAFDTTAIAGESLTTTIDIDLQTYAESLMQNKIGSVVAIEPKTGEILTMVSSISYDPNLLAGTRQYSKNFNLLLRDPLIPLYNRPLQAGYRPGSIFKLVQGLVSMQLGAITPNSVFPDGSAPVKCHRHPSGHNDLHNAIQFSCNPYFYQVFRHNIYFGEQGNSFRDSEAGLLRWRNSVMPFGFGRRLGIDLPNEKRGFVPDSAYFNKVYGLHAWKFSNWYSMSIGEGELVVVPLQMANLAAIIANRGYYYTPHLARKIGKDGLIDEKYRTKRSVGVDPRHFDVVVEGMADAVRAGTVWSGARSDSVVMCGKTGTSQNKIGKDHSVFVAFAPKDDPKIAIAVYVENAGFGGLVAAPIATLIAERFILGHTPAGKRQALEKLMREKSFLPAPKIPVLPTLPQGDNLMRAVKSDSVAPKAASKKVSLNAAPGAAVARQN